MKSLPFKSLSFNRKEITLSQELSKGTALPLPTKLPVAELQQGLQERTPWFYSYSFTNGASIAALDADHVKIHQNRTEAVFFHLDQLFNQKWQSIKCIDVACHEGWFSFQTALRNAKSVQSFDIRADHIEKARWVQDVSGIKNVSFEEGDLFKLDPNRLGTFDLVFFLGIFYHLENPMGALRIARSLTAKNGVCVLEGQVARDQTISIGWGPVGHDRQGPGVVVLPGEPIHAHEPAGVVVVPSLQALRLMLLHAGFKYVHLVLPTLDAYPAFQNYDRVILFAYA